MLGSIFASGNITYAEIAICTIASLILGVIVALSYMFRNTYTKGMVVTLALLPALIQSVILLVNGNLGAGVAVMGAFSLVRFRSAPGSARDIASIFFSMAIGLATGMGYVVYAVGFTIVFAACTLVYQIVPFGEKEASFKTLKITIPEDLDYTGLFDDVFHQFTSKNTLESVRTVNLGSLYELTYSIVLKDTAKEKAMIDEIRCRNGNLNIVCARNVGTKETL